jgi:ABC-type branched-subunit amino acid transport system substrate-binding protein
MNFLSTGHPGGLGFLQALDEINANPSILPSHRIVGWYNSTDGDVYKAVAVTTELIQQRNAHAIIGDFSSDPSQTASLVCRLNSIPQLSPNALATVFDTTSQYPTFFRGIASIVSPARALAHVVQALGYQRLAVIATTAVVDQSTIQAFQTEANLLKLQIVTSQVITAGTCDSMSFQMQQLKASKMRVFGLFGLAGDAKCIMVAANNAGLVGPGYLWFGAASSLTDPTVWQNGTGAIIPQYYNLFQNFIGTLITVERNTTAESNFAAAYTARPYNPQFFTASGRAPNAMSALSRDAVYAIALAWHNATAIQNLNVVSQPSLALPALLATNFNGLTGSYSFNPNTHSRAVNFDIVQPQNGALIKIGICYSASTFQVELNGAIVFPGGQKPPERDPYVVVTAGFGVFISSVAIASVGVLLCIAMAVLVQRNIELPFVKASSPGLMMFVLIGHVLVFALLPVGALTDTLNDVDSIALKISCQAYQIMISAAFILVFVPLLAKTARIAAIFGGDTLKVQVISNATLYALIAGSLLIDLGINISWILIDSPSPLLAPLDDTNARMTCHSNTNIFLIASVAYKGVILVGTLIACWKVRNVPSEFNESRAIFGAVYQSTFLLAFVIPLSAFVNSPVVVQVASQVGLAIASIVNICVLFWPSIYVLVFGGSIGNAFQPGGSKNSKAVESAFSEHSRASAYLTSNCPHCGKSLMSDTLPASSMELPSRPDRSESTAFV